MSIQSRCPTTGTIHGEYPETTAAEIEEALSRALTAFATWRNTLLDQRADLMRSAARVLKSSSDSFALLMAREMGKPVREGRAEVEKCVWVCEYYAEHAADLLAPTPVETDASESFVAFEPIGPVLAVMPWNFPFWQVFRFAAPTLMAGNTGLLKHASNVPECAQAIEDVFEEAGFPAGVFQKLFLGSDRVAALIEDERIRAVTLTGSTPAGRSVAEVAGRCLKKTVLELGGSDPYLILRDADLSLTVEACATARLINTGQSCIAAKRFIVTEANRADFEQDLVEAMAAKVVGDPTEETTELGPMARVDLRDELHDQVARSLERGARCLLGGLKPEGPGAFYPATVLTDVAPGMPAYHEELFGPVAAIIPVADEVEAIRVANDSPFGLGAAVFTRDVEHGREIAHRQLEAGCCFVNTFVRSDPRLPFGGIKESGYGRELGSFGIYEFVNIKTVYVA